MGEFTSQHIPKIEQTAARPITTVDSSGWSSKIASGTKHLSPEHTEQGRAILNKWQTSFPTEATWVQENVGTPSLITRLDATIKDGDLVPYEVEERPSGIGLSYEISRTFQDRLERVRTTWPDFKVVISDDPRRKGIDDSKWATITGPDTTGLVLVRAEPEEEAYHHLEGQSVSSLHKKGNKSYGVEMGLWEEVGDPEELDWEDPFVMKPLSGSKTRDVFVWIPKPQYKEYTPPGSKSPKGVHTRTKITNALSENGSMYVQPFHKPIETGDPDHAYEIYRVYYGYDIKEGEWTYLGGVSNARNSLIIHGASDTLFQTIE